MDQEEPSSPTNALEVLREPVADAGGTLPRVEAKAELRAAGYSEGSVDRILRSLENQGQIYVVDDGIRITPED